MQQRRLTLSSPILFILILLGGLTGCEFVENSGDLSNAIGTGSQTETAVLTNKKSSTPKSRIFNAAGCSFPAAPTPASISN